MPPSPDTPEQPANDRLNELYWDTEQTIGDITDQLGVSRNALYTAIRPRAAGATCPSCGERMVHTNRTQRDSGVATCRACGMETEVGRLQGTRSEPTGNGRAGGTPEQQGENGGYGDSGWARWREDLAMVEPERYALVGGAAALGMVVGAAAARALRHRM